MKLQENKRYFRELIMGMKNPVHIHVSYNPDGAEFSYTTGVKDLQPSEAIDYLVRSVERYSKEEDYPFEQVPFDVSVQTKNGHSRLEFHAELGKSKYIRAMVSDHPLNAVQRTTFDDSQSIERLLTHSQ
ncbi:MAG TPA: hypothetical protein VI564_01215 [Candidatus Nanoarchaeia archaeon]|nr:hypothetical protein [Candidatus Nanoarchaeia archaeon]